MCVWEAVSIGAVALLPWVLRAPTRVCVNPQNHWSTMCRLSLICKCADHAQ